MEKTESLKLNRDFRRAYSKGKTAASPSVAMYVRKTKSDMNRLGITVSTKIGKAVVRNRIRRRLREIYRINEKKLAVGYDIVLVARHRCRGADFWELEADFLHLCRKLSVYKEEIVEKGDDI